MVAVAMVALAMGVSQWVSEMKKRRTWYRSQAAESRRWEEINLRNAQGWKEIHEHLRRTVEAGDLDGEREIEEAESNMFDCGHSAVRAARERELYEHFAAHPWEPPPADPQARGSGSEILLLFETSPGVLYAFSSAGCAKVALAAVVGAAGCGFLVQTNITRFRRRNLGASSGT